MDEQKRAEMWVKVYTNLVKAEKAVGLEHRHAALNEIEKFKRKPFTMYGTMYKNTMLHTAHPNFHAAREFLESASMALDEAADEYGFDVMRDDSPVDPVFDILVTREGV